MIATHAMSVGNTAAASARRTICAIGPAIVADGPSPPREGCHVTDDDGPCVTTGPWTRRRSGAPVSRHRARGRPGRLAEPEHGRAGRLPGDRAAAGRARGALHAR